MSAFLPWLAFWGQASNQLVDKSFLNIGLTHSTCTKIEKKIKVQIARTRASRAHGLGGRSTPLKTDEGMLFIFDAPELASFWMKDTLIPLEITFYDSKGLLINLRQMPVEKDPANPKIFYSAKRNASLVLETAPKTLQQMNPTKPPLQLCVDSMPASN